MKKLISLIMALMFLISIGAVCAADGDILWTRAYDIGSSYASSVAVDSQNNVIVTGGSGTIKYNSSGSPVWPGAIGISGNGVAVDSQNNVIVTGGSGTMKYDANGNPIWAGPIGISGNGVAVDSHNNIVVAGGSSIIKYDTNGNPVWPGAIAFSGTTRDVTVDSQDNIIVGGRTNDYYLMKLDPNGNLLWDKSIDITSSTDYGDGVAVDSHDNIIFTGWFYDPDPTIEYGSCTIKYTPSGTEIWRITDNTGDRWSYKVAVDSYDDVVLAGGKYDSFDTWQYLTVKYDANGNPIWEREYDSGYASGNDDCYDVAIDSLNNVLITGRLYNGSNYDYYTIKYEGISPTKKSLPIQQFLKILGILPKE